MSLRFVFAVGVVSACTSVASAATTTVFGSGNHQSPTVSKFDPTLGLLQNIILNYSIGGNINALIENHFYSGPKSGSFFVSGLQYELDSSSGDMLGTAAPAVNLSSSYYVAAATDNAFGYSSYSLPVTTVSEMITLTDAANLAAFTGSGPYVFTTRSTGGAGSLTGSAQFDGYTFNGIVNPLSVTYTYLDASAVPEPAAIALFGAGLTLVRLARRRTI